LDRFKTSSLKNIGTIGNFTDISPLDFHEFDLPNKLHCILLKDSRIPMVNLLIGYNVGSKDEIKNKKGIAHLFEHLMFQGSENIKKNEHFSQTSRLGGTCNAFTMQDATVYFDIAPSNNLETILWLESDRMNSLDLSEENLENQKKVVIEEKKQRFENAPYGSMMNNLFENVFKNSAYEFPVIGFEEDIHSFTVKEALEFHENYYSPENSVLILTGDIDINHSKKLISKYFADIKKNNKFQRTSNQIADIKENKRIEIYDNIKLPMLCIAYQLPKAGSPEEYSMEYFSEIIANNKSSRLYKKLVYEKKLVRSVSCEKVMLKDGGILSLNAQINPETDINTVEKEILDAVNDIAINGCSDEEFGTIKNQLEFQNTAKYLKLINISINTVFKYLYYKDISGVSNEINKYLSVTKDEMINSVKEYLQNRNSVTLTYLPMNLKK